MSVTDFLQDLRNRYGEDISIKSFIVRITGVKATPPDPRPLPSSTNSDNFDETSKNSKSQSSLESVAQYGIKGDKSKGNREPIIIPPKPPGNKFSPVNIGSLKDWLDLRMTVLDLHDFKNFFAGKQDSQSPQFRNLIENYAKEAEKNLAQPSEIDASSSKLFVENLSEVIEKRFFMILKSCKPGLVGRGKMPHSYYYSLDLLVKKYFKNIGLESCNVRPRTNYREWLKHMKVTGVIEAPFPHLQDLISEVEVPPHYFKFINEDGEEDVCWIDGEYIVYKKKG